MVTTRDNLELELLERTGDPVAAEIAGHAVTVALEALAIVLAVSLGVDPANVIVDWRVLDGQT